MDPSEVRYEYGVSMTEHPTQLGMEPLYPYPPSPPPPPPQQQQTSVVMLNAPAPIPQPAPLIQSFVGHIVLACCTFWCCGVAFGLAAFILAGK